MVKNEGSRVFAHNANINYLIGGDIVLNVSIKRSETQSVIKVKSDIPGEKVFTFDSLSPNITQKSIRLIIPMLIESEREARIKKAHRKQQLREIRQAKAEQLLSSEEEHGKEIE